MAEMMQHATRNCAANERKTEQWATGKRAAGEEDTEARHVGKLCVKRLDNKRQATGSDAIYEEGQATGKGAPDGEFGKLSYTDDGKRSDRLDKSFNFYFLDSIRNSLRLEYKSLLQFGIQPFYILCPSGITQSKAIELRAWRNLSDTSFTTLVRFLSIALTYFYRQQQEL